MFTYEVKRIWKGDKLIFYNGDLPELWEIAGYG